MNEVTGIEKQDVLAKLLLNDMEVTTESQEPASPDLLSTHFDTLWFELTMKVVGANHCEAAWTCRFGHAWSLSNRAERSCP